MSMNTCAISGNLTRDPILRTTQGGTKVLTFSVAVNDRRKNPQTDEWEDYPNFIDCVMFGNRAESLSNLIAKGHKVSVQGKLRWSQWEKDGSKRSKVEVVADEVEIMSRRGQQEAAGQPQQQQANNYTNQPQSGQNPARQQPQNGFQQQQYYDEDCPFS